MSANKHPKVEIVTYSTLFPNFQDSIHGVFVKTRLQHLVASKPISSRVLAPVPWFPFASPLFGHYSRFARVEAHENHEGLSVSHPKFPLIPKIGMALAPASLFLGSIGAMRRLQKERDFDLIDAHYLYPDGVAAIWLGQALNKPVIITARGTDVSLIPKYRLPRRMILNAARKAAGIITVSQALKDALVELGVPEDHVTVLRNGVDLDLFCSHDREAVRADLGLAGPTLLSVGHLIERKGHDLIIGALPKLPGFSLMIAGAGPEHGRLERLSSELGVKDRVRFLGVIPHANLSKTYAAADALVLASSREGWPNVLLEAMACGTPVVASNIWGNPEVVSKTEAGVLMKERTSEGVVEAVRRLFQDLPERSVTRRYAEGFSWDATSEGQYRLFKNILSNRADLT